MRLWPFRVLFLSALLGIVGAVPAFAQNPKTVVLDFASECNVLDVAGMGTAAIDVVGTFTGTIAFTISVTGGDYSAVNATPPNTGTAVVETTTTGRWSAAVAGYRYLRACMSAYTSGSATVTLSAAPGGGGGSGLDSATIGEVQETPTQYTVLGRLASLEGLFEGFNPPGTAEGATWSDGSASTVVSGRVTTNASAGTGVGNGEVGTLNFDTNGRLRINATPYDSSGVEITSSDKVEDEVVAGAERGPVPLTRRIDAAASTAGASADYAMMNTDALGLLWTRNLDPCSGVAKSYIPIDITTATTTELTSALAGTGNHYYVCALNIVTTAANNVSLVDDDSDNCGSVTSGIIGGLTAGEGWNFAANGGLTIGNGVGSVMRTNGTNRVLCLVTSAATELHGHIVVAAAP